MTKKAMLIKLAEIESDAWEALELYKSVYGAYDEITYRLSGEWLMASRIKQEFEKEVR
jgi:hypothetical protein|nr:MAG TPA: hypothetical protein [Caudoviricetes sp.]